MKKAKVMVVEDEVITGLDLVGEVEDFGYEACPLATTGEQAMEIAEQERPDLILMDIGLSEEMDGITISRELYSRFGIRTIYMTGYVDPGIMKEAQGPEAYGYLIKPIETSQLRLAIEAALNKSNKPCSFVKQ